MSRALLIVLDSVGIGHAPDAADFGDEGANTLGHIYEDQGPTFSLPTLESLGLNLIRRGAAGEDVSEEFEKLRPAASIGWMKEQSGGKDTTTGHWEITGIPTEIPLDTVETFPKELIADITARSGFEFIGNFPRSGTEILDELGAEHLETGKPILYTSADSVLQIAAHEELIPIEKLYALCQAARAACDDSDLHIGRVIARPFIGSPGDFQRTAKRKDFSLIPPPTVLNALVDAGKPVISVGKISDIFAGSGISTSSPTKDNAGGMAAIEELWPVFDEGLIFANLVDFDSKFGHRRDPAGYAGALMEFDAWLKDFLPLLIPGDLFIITADHGNDPTWKGSDHTREMVPLIAIKPTGHTLLGQRPSFSDIGASLAQFFEAPDWTAGKSFL